MKLWGSVGGPLGMPDDAKAFKEFIEAQGASTGSWRGNVDAPGNAATDATGTTPVGPTSTDTSRLAAAPDADPAMDDPESGGPRAGL